MVSGQALNKAIELNPNYANAFSNRGRAYNGLKQYEKAISDYNKAIELGPNNAIAVLNLSELEITRGKYSEALIFLGKNIPLLTEDKDQAIYFYIKSIISKLLKLDTSKSESKLDQVLSNHPKLTWSFDEIETWLDETQLPDDVKQFIIDKTEMMKKYT